MWGFSQIHAELILLLKANDTNHYDHYHLLSGQDLPIQTQENIQSFFLNNSGKEFVSFDSFENFKFKERVIYQCHLVKALSSVSSL